MKKIALILVFALMMTFVLGSLTAVFAEDGDETETAVEDNFILAESESRTVGESEENSTKGTKAVAAAIVVAVAAAAGAIGMAVAISKSAESMSRQPEAAGKINSAMMLGLVFIETAIIYALIVAILIIFVL